MVYSRRVCEPHHIASMLRATVLALVASVAAIPPRQIVCDTTVQVGDGRIIIELWEQTAPIGVKRFVELVNDGFFEDLPFFRAIPNFLVQFGISTDHDKQLAWNRKGNIPDDPKSSIPFTDGIVSVRALHTAHA
jgi:hypothetical protein